MKEAGCLGTLEQVSPLNTHTLATGQCPQPSMDNTEATRAQELPSAHSTLWNQTLESPLWLVETQKTV